MTFKSGWPLTEAERAKADRRLPPEVACNQAIGHRERRQRERQYRRYGGYSPETLERSKLQSAKLTQDAAEPYESPIGAFEDAHRSIRLIEARRNTPDTTGYRQLRLPLFAEAAE